MSPSTSALVNICHLINAIQCGHFEVHLHKSALFTRIILDKMNTTSLYSSMALFVLLAISAIIFCCIRTFALHCSITTKQQQNEVSPKNDHTEHNCRELPSYDQVMLQVDSNDKVSHLNKADQRIINIEIISPPAYFDIYPQIKM